jgi:hypothetical protein
MAAGGYAPMRTLRLVQPAAPVSRTLPAAAWLGRAWSCWWTALKDHMADLHGIPRARRWR